MAPPSYLTGVESRATVGVGSILWLDAQLPPSLAPWLAETFDLDAAAVRDLGLRDGRDEEILVRARDGGAVVMAEDSGLLLLLERLGPPPQIHWMTSGNTSNAHLRSVLQRGLARALELLEAGERLVELR